MRVRPPPSALPVVSEATGVMKAPHRAGQVGRRRPNDAHRKEQRMDSARMVEQGTILRGDRRLDGPRPPSRRPGRPGRDGRLHRAARVPARTRAAPGFAAGSTASSTTSSERSPRGLAPGRGSRPRRIQPAEVHAARAQGPPDDPAAALRPGRSRARGDGARPGASRAAARDLSRRAGRGYLGYLRGQKERLLGRAARRASTGPSSSRPTATTRSTRCTPPGSATRASSCSRRAG